VDLTGHRRSRGAALNASPADQQRLLDLQTIDSQIAQLAHRRSRLPELAELDALAEQLRAVADDLVGVQTDRSDVAREAGKLDRDIEQVRARADRDQQRMNSGAVGSAKELESLQHEITSLQRRQNELEDAELEILQRVEDLDHAVNTLTTRQRELTDQQADAEARRDAAWAQIDEETRSAEERRSLVVADVPAELLALYDKLRDQLGGVAVVALKQRRCDGCRLELNAIEVGRFRDAPEDAVLRCEECRRIVVRTAESGL
jgi:predicted  nucleic acid-binding Zn-ribbon protein